MSHIFKSSGNRITIVYGNPSWWYLPLLQTERVCGKKVQQPWKGAHALVFLHQKQKLCILFSFVGTAIICSVHPTKSATASSQSAVFFSDNKLAPATSYQPQTTKQSELYTVSTHPYTTHKKLPLQWLEDSPQSWKWSIMCCITSAPSFMNAYFTCRGNKRGGNHVIF